jgi:SAM-dependent methyltransferase
MSWYKSWFDSPYYHALYAHRDHKEADLFGRTLIDYLKPPPKAHILDLACGNGRHSHAMATLGYEVTGIDLSAQNIAAAQSNKQSKARFIRADMRTFSTPESFELSVNLFTSFGYFEDETDNQKVLQKVFENLKPNGCFVLDFFCRDYIEKHLVEKETIRRQGIDFQVQRFINGEEVIKEIRFETQGRSLRYEEVVRGFRKSELERMVQEAGFSIDEVFGNYALRPFMGAQSERCILICSKK